nr:MAG TPA: SITE SPECIFIC RECOMBINASE XERD [Caudoviricetes sp.]
MKLARSRGVYNRVYTPELWEQVNPENKAILEDFLAEYRQQKKANSTIEAYFQDGRFILIYVLLHHKNKSILEMSKKDFRNMSIWLSEDCNMSANRVNRLKATVNSMLTYCEEDDEYNYDINYAKKVKGLPRERVKTNDDDFFFTFKEFIAVRDRLVETGDLQTAVLWSLSYDSAGRRNEIYQVKKTGLLDGNKTNIVRGKRGKTFPLVYLNDTKELIRQYLEERGDDDIESLWINGHGKNKVEVTKDALYNRILKCSKILSEIRGEEVNIFPHSIRHSRLECLSTGQDERLKNPDGTNKVFDLDHVRVVAHHTDVGTTQGYLKNKDEDVINDMFGFEG